MKRYILLRLLKIDIFNSRSNIIPFTFDNGNSFIVPNDIIVMIFFNHWYI